MAWIPPGGAFGAGGVQGVRSATSPGTLAPLSAGPWNYSPGDGTRRSDRRNRRQALRSGA